MYKHLENKMCKELEALEEKYRTGAEMSEGDLRRIDLLVHSLKSMATYKAMKEAEEYNPNIDNSSYMNSSRMNNSYMNNSYADSSYARGRDGRFVSRDHGMMSGHYPMNYPPMYPEERRW